MKAGLIDFLSCPSCSGNLNLQVDDQDGDHIVSGKLVCPQQHRFHIRDGVPRFVDRLKSIESRTQNVFGTEWITFNDYHASNLGQMAVDLPQDFFSDKLVLDAGCGGGRHAVELNAIWGAENVIGVDLSEAVMTAYERTREVDGIHILQASIYDLPFEKNFFDIVFCLGVLQHLPDPHGAFSNLASHLKPGGRIVIWVYKRSLRKRLLEIPRTITKRLPVVAQRFFSLVISIMFYPMVIIYKHFHMSLLSHFREYSKYDWSTYRTDWFDRLSAPLTNYYEETEIRDWLKEQSLRNIQVSSYGDFFIRGYGTKS